MTAQTIEALVNPFARQSSEGPQRAQSQSMVSPQSIDDPLIKAALLLFTDDMYRYDDLPVLAPEKIDMVLQYIKARYDRKDVESEFTGAFISRLMSKSQVMLDTKKFTLTTGDYRIINLPIFTSKVCIQVEGNVGDYTGIYGGAMRNDTLTVSASAGSNFGNYSLNFRCDIRGNVGEYCGYTAQDGVFTIHGDAADGLGANARDSTFTVYGAVGRFLLQQAENCIFQTPHRKIFEYESRHLEDRSPNICRLIDMDGNILKEVKS